MIPFNVNLFLFVSLFSEGIFHVEANVFCKSGKFPTIFSSNIAASQFVLFSGNSYLT